MSGPDTMQGLKATLAKDEFGMLRTDAQLGKLVADVARGTPRPYCQLVGMLLGNAPKADEARARQQWVRFVEHRRDMATALGRPVHLRVAAIDLLMQLGKGLSPAVVSRAALDDLVTSATTDGLTGLTNRTEFVTILGHELRQRSTVPLVVAYLDVDAFKQVNDVHGHGTGDAVLQAIGANLKQQARKGDVMARLGGDEFAALLVGTTATRARALFNRVEAALAPLLGKLGASLSVGLVEPVRGASPDDVLHQADEAMYQRKRRKQSLPTPAADAASTDARPVVVYATKTASRYLSLQHAFAAWGYPLVPAATPEVAGALARLLPIKAVLADVMFPPRGGEALLRALPPMRLRGGHLLVAPQRWWGMKGNNAFPVLKVPPDEGMADLVFRRLLKKALPPLPAIGAEGEAVMLAGAIQAALSGKKVSSERLATLGQRAEWDVVRRHLGW